MPGGAKAIDNGADFIAFDFSPPAADFSPPAAHAALPPTSTPRGHPSLPAKPSFHSKPNGSASTPARSPAGISLQSQQNSAIQSHPEAGPSRVRDSAYHASLPPSGALTSNGMGMKGSGGDTSVQGQDAHSHMSAHAAARLESFRTHGTNSSDAPSAAEPKGGKQGDTGKASKKARKLERKKAKEEKKKNKSGGVPTTQIGGPPGERTGPKNLQEQRRAESRAAPWVDMNRMARCGNPGQMLNEEVAAFYQFVSPTREEFEIRLYLIELISRAIYKLWPDAVVTPFGSWQTQLYLPSGDIDLVVEHHNVGATKSSRALHLGALGRALREANITDTVAVIANAKVPIIKFVTLDGRINVDISLNQTNGIASGKIINQYLDVIPGSRQLIMVVKSFLSQRSMNEVFTGGLGSYCVICMVISFLQIHPKLRSSQMDAEKNLGTLLVEFFELYGRNFNYDQVGLSIRRGGFYFDKRAKGWFNEARPFLLSVEDPQDPDSDIGGNSFGVRTVRGAMAGAFELLTGRMFERSTQMAMISAGGNGNIELPDDLSILSAVMGFSPDMVRKRQSLTALHQEGRLQRMLRLPTNANLSDHLTHYMDPMQVGGKRSRLPSPTPPSKKLKGDSMIQAIVVDDDSDVEDYLATSSEEGELLSAADASENGKLSGNGGTEVVYPNGNGVVRRDRFASVSEDGEIQERQDDDKEESRYAVNAKTRSRARPQGATSLTRAVALASDDVPNSSSDDSESYATAASTLRSHAPAPTAPKVLSKSEKRAFWAAKAGAGRDERALDDIAAGEDFVSFD